MNYKLILSLFWFSSFGCSSNEQTKIAVYNVKNVNATGNKWNKLEDNEKIGDFFKRNGKVYCGEVQYNEYPMRNIDSLNFWVFPGSKYAKDKNNVFYPLQILCEDGKNYGVCFCTEYLVQGADPTTFKILDKDYALDKDNAYFRGIKIKDSDGKTFSVIKGPEFFYFAKDNNHVYIHEEIFPEADPSTFNYDIKNRLNDTLIHRYIIKDKNNEWEYFPPYGIKNIRNKKNE